MPNIFTEILHCDNGTSDKVYIVEVNEISNNYVVSATWGKRNAPRLSSQIKNEYLNSREALACAQKLIQDKQRGKDEYKKAESKLDIPGFKRNVTSAAELHADTKVAPNPITAANTPMGRKLNI